MVIATAIIGAATTRNAATNCRQPPRNRSYVEGSLLRSHHSHATIKTGKSLSGWYVYSVQSATAAPASAAVHREDRASHSSSASSATAPKNGTIVFRIPSRLMTTSHNEVAAQAAAVSPTQVPQRRARNHTSTTPATPKPAAAPRRVST